METSSDCIQEIRTHAKEAVDIAINHFMTDEEKKQLNVLLNKLNSALKAPVPKKKKPEGKRHKIPDDKEFLVKKIIPQIRENIKKYDDQQNSHIGLTWRLNLTFIEEFNEGKIVSLDIIKKTLQDIKESEQITTNIHLLTAFFMGMSYLMSRQYAEGSVKAWFRKEFNVSYVKAKTYENFTILIKTYPGLIVCGLSFTQLTKHRERLLTFLETDLELAEVLRTNVTIRAQGRNVNINHMTVDNIPCSSFKPSTDPDNVYESDDWYSDDQSADEDADFNQEVVGFIVKEAAEARMERLTKQTAKTTL